MILPSKVKGFILETRDSKTTIEVKLTDDLAQAAGLRTSQEYLDFLKKIKPDASGKRWGSKTKNGKIYLKYDNSFLVDCWEVLEEEEHGTNRPT